jgi:peroxiredoxin
MKRCLIALCALVAVAFLSAAEPVSSSPPPGLAIGAKGPDFTLPGSTGQAVALSRLTAKGRVAVVFVRSADWCPYCRKQLQDLERDRAAIEATGVQLIAISYDSLATNDAATSKLGLTFPLLSDAGSKVIDAYGIRNHEAKGRAAGVPHPVVFILDQEGVIRAKLARDNYRDRPESAEIIAAVRSLK